MKTNNLTKLTSGLLLLCFSFFLAPSTVFGQTDAGQKQYKFTNEANSAADSATDLHIKFRSEAVSFVPPNPNPNGDATQQVPSGTFPDGNANSGPNTIDLANGFTGAAVDSGGSVILTFSFPGNTPPSVQEWWWTNDNNLDPNTGRLGNKKRPRRGTFSFVSTPSTGDGWIDIIMEGITSTFAMLPELTGEETAQSFADFVENDILWLDVESIDGTTVKVFPTAFSEELDDFTVDINQDSTQLVGFKYEPEIIPTLTQWGIIILLLLVLAVGMVFLYQRQTSLAVAGVAETSNAKPKLFDRKLFTKVFAVTLLIGLAGLVSAYLYYGQITNADPFGTLVSAGIVAYMVHLWLLRKGGE